MKKLLTVVMCLMGITFYLQAQDAQQALMEAIDSRNLDNVKKVVEEFKADVNKPYSNPGVGNPYALHRACRSVSASLEIVQYLLEKGADVNVEDKFNAIPLSTLVASADTTNRIAIAKLLIEKGSNINAVSGGGYSVLGYAAFYNQVAVVKILLAKGADLEARKNKFADTPLMAAASKGNFEIVELLHKAGADPAEVAKKSTRGGLVEVTAADLAKQGGFTEVYNYLKGAKKIKVKK